MVSEAIRAGHKVVIVDGSPIPEIASTFRTLGAEVYPQLHKGMGPSRREVFFHATEVAWREKIEYILWTEPEKVDLIRSIPQIIAGLHGADIVIVGRVEKSWGTWPAFQVESEKAANAVYNEACGVEGFDPMHGPVAFTLVAAKNFIDCRGDGGDVPDTYIQHYAPIKARSRGLGVGSVKIDITYPPEQRAEEEGAQNEAMIDKRRWQLETLTKAYRTLANTYK